MVDSIFWALWDWSPDGACELKSITSQPNRPPLKLRPLVSGAKPTRTCEQLGQQSIRPALLGHQQIPGEQLAWFVSHGSATWIVACPRFQRDDFEKRSPKMAMRWQWEFLRKLQTGEIKCIAFVQSSGATLSSLSAFSVEESINQKRGLWSGNFKVILSIILWLDRNPSVTEPNYSLSRHLVYVFTLQLFCAGQFHPLPVWLVQ